MILDFNNDTGQDFAVELFTDLLMIVPKVIPNIPEERVELLLTDNETIQEFNKTYRGKDCPTDVLSFAEREIESPHPSDNLGQVVISVERAKEQAKEIGHSLEEELQFLFTHGLLHVLGFDHEDPSDEEDMLDKAYKILGRKPLD